MLFQGNGKTGVRLGGYRSLGWAAAFKGPAGWRFD
jgi:hypothetical protein